LNVLVTGTSYFPEYSAGTEVYVRLVCQWLEAQGDTVFIACGGSPDRHAKANPKWSWVEYQHEGIPVIKIVRNPARAELADPFARQDPERHALWKRIFEHTAPDLIFTVGRSPALMGDIEVIGSEARVPVAATFIHPGQLCPKGPRIDDRGRGCMIALNARVCGACLVRSQGGFPGLYTAMRLLGARRLAPWLGGTRLGTAVRLPQLVDGFLRHWEEIRAAVSLFVAHSQAAVELLRVNGVPAAKILLSPPGFEALAQPEGRSTKGLRPVKFGFVGRLCREKGLRTLFRAWHLLGNDLPAELHLWGNAAQGDTDVVKGLTDLASRDNRVVFHGPFSRADTAKVYAGMDVLLVPSEWFDNCPFVISEAFAAGVPVVGSDFGGISSMIRDGVDGFLFPMHDERALARILIRLVSQPSEVAALARNVRPPRDPREHLEDLRQAFDALLSRESTR
jgi:glycosyltransferase involved in cell wall biosynthesis